MELLYQFWNAYWLLLLSAGLLKTKLVQFLKVTLLLLIIIRSLYLNGVVAGSRHKELY